MLMIAERQKVTLRVEDHLVEYCLYQGVIIGEEQKEILQRFTQPEAFHHVTRADVFRGADV